MSRFVRLGFNFAATLLPVVMIAGFGEARTYFVPSDSAPYQLQSGDTLYLRPGGTLYSYTEIGGPSTSPGSITLNVEGGRVYGNLTAGSGSRINVYSGFIHSDIAAKNGSAINVFGGQLFSLSGAVGSSVALHGGEFRIDGLPIDGLTTIGQTLQLDVPEGALLSGTYSDGTPFAFTSRGMSDFAPGTLSLIVTEVPPLGPTEIVASTDLVPATLRAGQRLLIDTTIDQSIFAGHGSTVDVAAYNYSNVISMGTVNVTNGELGAFVALEGSEFNIRGGRVGSYFEIRPGSVVNLTGGTMDGGNTSGELNVTGGSISYRLGVWGGGSVNVSGGTISALTEVGSNGSLKMSDGSIPGWLSITSGGHVSISGGSARGSYVADSGMLEISGGTLGQLSVDSGGTARIVGGEFALNGVPISGLNSVGDTLNVVVDESSAISGTLADGTPFMFSAQDIAEDWSGDQFDGTLILQRAALPAIGPSVLIASRDTITNGIRRGQSLVVDAPGVVGDDFSAGPGSIVNIVAGGEIGANFEATAAEVNVTGGTIRYRFDAAAGTVVKVTGGEVFGGAEILNSSKLILSGGTVHGLGVKSGGTAEIVGGVADNLEVAGGLAEISGGTIGTDARVYAGGQAIISGGTFSGTIAAEDHGVIRALGGKFIGPLLTWGSGEIRFNGGEALQGFVANPGGRVIIEGGTVRGQTTAGGSGSSSLGGSEVVVRGGVIDGPLTAQIRSKVEISGGVLGDGFQSSTSSNVLVVGGDFRLNGEPIPGTENVGSELQLNIASNSTLTGVLLDGTPFAFQTVSNSSRYDSFAAGTLRLKTVDLPATHSRTIYASTDPVPLSIRGNERLIVDAGGRIDNNFMAGPGSQLEVHEDGVVGRNLEAIGAVVEINGGEIGPNLGAFGGSVVNIRAGKIEAGLEAHAGSVVNISGGVLGAPIDSPERIGRAVVAYDGSSINVSGGEVNGLRPQPGSTINVTGGRIGDSFQAQEHTTVRLAGGSIGDHFAMQIDSQLRIVGGDFRVNGDPISGLSGVGDTLQVEVDPFSVLTGVFQDGTPFSFAHADADYINGTMTLEVARLPTAEARYIRVSTDPVPLGIRGPQVLDVDAGATLGANFSAGAGSTVNIHLGSTVAHNFEAIGGIVNIAGNVLENFNAFEGSVVNVDGGSIGPFSDAFHGSVINVSAGTVGEYFSAHAGSTVNISGGRISEEFNAYEKSVINISGGTIEREFQAFSDSQVNLFGTEFLVNGIAVEDLQLGQAFTLSDRDVMLTGKFADGSEFSFQLENNYPFNWPYWYERPRNYFDDAAILTLTRVHNPGDYNGDGRVTEADHAVWLAAMSTGDLAADGNFDRQVTLDDLRIWEERLGTVYFGVPECSSAVLAGVAMALAGLIRNRRSTQCN